MKPLAIFVLAAIATLVCSESIEMMELTLTSESVEMMELTPSKPSCDVSRWCESRQTAERCDKVDYCNKWIWSDDRLGISCADCKEVVQELLAYNKTLIDFICNELPFGKAECKAALQKLISKVTPQEICHDLRMCNASDLMIAREIFQKTFSRFEEEPNIDTCQVCQLVAGLMLENADTLKGLLEGLCNKTGITVECDVLVDALIAELKKMNATQICKEVKLCSADQSNRLLGGGGDMCTRGPAYWCASLDNAKECQALHFCEKKIWR